MKNILIISECFAPENAIGAIRMTKVAKYLVKNNYNVTVIAKADIRRIDPILNNDINNIGNIIRVCNSKKHKKFESLVLTKKENTQKTSDSLSKTEEKKVARGYKYVVMGKLREIRDLIIFKYNNRDFTKQAIRAIRSQLSDLKFDVVISTYSPISNHSIALWVKKHNKNVRWIADFRDPIDPEYNKSIVKYLKHIEKKVCQYTDCITAVSSGYLDMIGEKNGKTEKVCIYNGFDLEDLNYIQNLEKKNNHFRIVIMGGFYDGRRDVSILFNVIADLIREGKILEEHIRIVYMGLSSVYLFKQILMCKLENVFQDFGRVNREEAIISQKSAQLLVSSAWNTETYKGVIPGKLFEQMLLKKPIIGVTLGNQCNSEMKKIIDTCKVGVCYEEATHEMSYQEIKEYIKTAYDYYLEYGRELYNPDTEQLSAFSYNKLIKQWIRIIENEA